MLLVDTNVLIDVFEDDPEWAAWSVHQLRAQSRAHRLLINGVVYAELSVAFTTVEALNEAVDGLQLRFEETPKPALFLAGKAFARYRREGGTKTSVLADFFIGAHAAVRGYPLLTRDPRRYRAHFPSVKLIAP